MERFLDETFLVLYGDNLWHGDFAPLVEFHRRTGAAATIATFEAADPSACGLVVADADGRVTRFQEKPPPVEVFTNTANAGVYVLEPDMLRHIPPGVPFDFARDLFPKLLDLGIIFTCPFTGYLQDTGTVDSYRRANWDVLEGRTGDAPASPHGLLLGKDVHVARDVRFTGRNIVGDRSVLGAGASLTESILWEGCRIGAGSSVSGAILGRDVAVGDGATVGDGAIVADRGAVAPGVRVPEGARIAPGEHFAGAG
jgi:mannose-1-phosphate guanylyltransferase/phosphomannomutase